MMAAAMHVVALTPFLMHVVTSLGLLSNIWEHKIEIDTSDSWTDTLLNLYRLGPCQGSSAEIIAYGQLILACIAMVTHFLGNADLRKISYAILSIMYAVTQIRHVLTSSGQDTIGYFYTHIAIFAIMVLYQDAIKLKSRTKTD